MSFWAGFKSCQIHYDVADRAFGTTKWSFLRLARYAISNIVSYSTRPLTIVSYMGVISLLAGVVVGIQTLVRWASGKALEGFTTVILLLLLLGGGILLGLIETFSKVYISTDFSDAIVFAVLILILLVKPAGLLGKQVQEKV
jgi:dolichol-phosphate mannosyltransferase